MPTKRQGASKAARDIIDELKRGGIAAYIEEPKVAKNQPGPMEAMSQHADEAERRDSKGRMPASEPRCDRMTPHVKPGKLTYSGPLMRQLVKEEKQLPEGNAILHAGKRAGTALGAIPPGLTFSGVAPYDSPQTVFIDLGAMGDETSKPGANLRHEILHRLGAVSERLATFGSMGGGLRKPIGDLTGFRSQYQWDRLHTPGLQRQLREVLGRDAKRLPALRDLEK